MYIYEKDVCVSVYMYINIYEFVHVCVCMYKHIFMHMCMYISICRHMHLEMHSPTYGMCMYVCMIWRVQQGAAVVPAAAYDLQCTCLHVFMYACMQACVYVCMHVCMHVCMYACVSSLCTHAVTSL